MKQQEKFQKSIHLLNELYFEYGSLENIPILPFDPENIREGDSLFTEVVAVINTENNETYFVTENDDMKLLKNVWKNYNITMETLLQNQMKN